MHTVARRWLLPAVFAVAVAAAAGATAPQASVAATAAAASNPQSAIAATVALTMLQGHYDKKPIDDALSAVWFDAFLDQLDYGRLYFLQSDIDEFAHWRTTLDDDVTGPAPKLEAAWAMHDRVLQRMRARFAAIDALLAANAFDFSDPDATVAIDRHDGPWAKTEAELDAVWRDRIAEQVLRMRLSNDPGDPVERLRKRFARMLAEQESLDAQDVLEAYLAGLTTAFDPHSVWFKPESKENFDIDMRDALTGIGAELRSIEGLTTITKLIAGGPAEAGGELKPDDKILAVAQGDGEPVDVVDMRIDKVVKLIRGKEGTTVALTVLPADAPDPSVRKIVRIVRERVKLDRAAAKGEVKTVDGMKIGVVDVPSFYLDGEARRAGDENWSSTARDTKRILADFHAQGVEAVVVDLRANGGGALDQAIELTGLFLEKGPVVQIRDRGGKVEVLHDEDPTISWSGPLVVLTTEASASASEIFAAAIQDHQRGIVVGSATTHGKGTVQNLLGLDRFLTRTGHPEYAELAGAIKFTTHKFYRVNGDSTQLKGVAADVVLPSPYEGLDVLEADLDHPMAWDRIAAVPHVDVGRAIDPAGLQAASAARVKASVDFGFLAADVAERKEIDARKTLSLYEPARKAELDALKQADADRDAERTKAGEDPKDPPDFLLDEALRITLDYVRLLRG